ncbi:RUS family member 1 [Balamuthia mandrillaris]
MKGRSQPPPQRRSRKNNGGNAERRDLKDSGGNISNRVPQQRTSPPACLPSPDRYAMIAIEERLVGSSPSSSSSSHLTSKRYTLRSDGSTACNQPQPQHPQQPWRTNRRTLLPLLLARPLYVLIFYLRAVFLPEGYPRSVSSDYLRYQLWDTLQALCSSVTGLLCTHAILEGVGVGRATATPAAAVVQWVIRDGTGMVGRIAFAWLQGPELDSNAKTWRFMADILNDLAMTMELLSPMFPEYFVLLACAGSVLKAIVGVAGGATRAAITVHQARNNNMADVSAKDGSQETAANLIGMLLGLAVTSFLNDSSFSAAQQRARIWLLFIILTALHLWANYRCVRGITMDTFNRQRLHLALDHWLLHQQQKNDEVKKNKKSPFLTPEEVSSKERVLWWDFGRRVELGARLSVVLNKNSSAHNQQLFHHFSRRSNDEKYLLLVSVKKRKEEAVMLVGDDDEEMRWKSLVDDDTTVERIYIVLHEETQPEDMLAGYCLAYCLWKTVQHLEAHKDRKPFLEAESVGASLQKWKEEFAKLKRGWQLAGWQTDRGLLGPSPWRLVWNCI